MRDIEEIIVQVQRDSPTTVAEQLVVSHPDADDDGLWFFRNSAAGVEVQLESCTGNCPFLFETSNSNERVVASSINHAVALIAEAIGYK